MLPSRCLAQYGPVPGRYVLFVGRLMPKNCANHLNEAFRGVGHGFPVRDRRRCSYAACIEGLRAPTNPRVVFTGDLFGEGYPELAGNARCFVETSEVGAAQKFGGRARALVRAHYSWESVADDDEWLFRDLLREAT